MQSAAIGRSSDSKSLQIDYRGSNQSKLRKRMRTQKTGHAAGFSGNDFLKTEIHPVAPQKIYTETDNGTENVLTGENYRYLLQSAHHYAGLIGKSLIHNPGHSLGEAIANLYKELEKLVPQEVNIEVSQNRLTFCLYEYHKWPDNTLFWLPVSFATKLHGKLQRLAITFLHEFALYNGMEYWWEHYDSDFLLYWVDECISSNEWGKEEAKTYIRLINSYRNGSICRFMKRVQIRKYYKRLPRALERYQPVGMYEKQLIALFKDGLQFIGSDTPSIMHYAYNPYDDYDNSDELTIDLDRIVRVVYDLDDPVNTILNDMVNQDTVYASYVVSPATCLLLTPELTAPFSKESYPERFADWMERFIEFISENEPSDHEQID